MLGAVCLHTAFLAIVCALSDRVSSAKTAVKIYIFFIAYHLLELLITLLLLLPLLAIGAVMLPL